MKRSTLVAKNREANEFRAKATEIRSELLDPNKDFLPEEVQKKLDAARAYDMRAQAAAEFTAEDEITRQGGDDDVRSVDMNGDENNAEVRRTTEEISKSMRLEIRSTFGSPLNYMRAIHGRIGMNSAQEKLLKKIGTETRAILGDSASGGEYLLPLTQVAEIFQVANQQPGLMTYARTYNVPGRSLRIPYLIQDEGDNTLNRPMAGKIANVVIVGEGQTKPAREPKFGQRLMTVYKYAAITQFGDELLGDDFTGELPTTVTNAIGQQGVNKINEDVTIDGNGSSQPLGALNDANTALLKIPRQTAGTFTAQDAFRMYEAHTHGPNSVWMISRRVLSKLFAMQTANNTMVTFIRDLNNKPQMLLLGLPVIVTDLLAPLGSQGDVALVNGEFYAMALRQALTIESSRDYAFVEDLTTYRFVLRAGGIPIPTGTYAYKFAGGVKVDEHSPFVVLDDVLAS